MKRPLLCILLCLSSAIFAQQQPSQEVPAENKSEASANSGQSEETASPAQPEEETAPDESGDTTEPGDRDFRPSEEISEDYPVPLPSDI